MHGGALQVRVGPLFSWFFYMAGFVHGLLVADTVSVGFDVLVVRVSSGVLGVAWVCC